MRQHDATSHLLRNECPDVGLDVGQPPSINFHIVSISTAAIILELWPFSFFFGWRHIWLNKTWTHVSFSFLFLYWYILKVRRLPPQGCMESYGVWGLCSEPLKMMALKFLLYFLFHSTRLRKYCLPKLQFHKVELGHQCMKHYCSNNIHLCLCSSGTCLQICGIFMITLGSIQFTSIDAMYRVCKFVASSGSI